MQQREGRDDKWSVFIQRFDDPQRSHHSRELVSAVELTRKVGFDGGLAAPKESRNRAAAKLKIFDGDRVSSACNQ